MIIQTRFVLFTEVVLQRFRADNFNLKDEDCSDRPATTNMDFIKAILAENSQYNVQEIVDTTNIFKKTVNNHLIKMGYVNRYEVWIP